MQTHTHSPLPEGAVAAAELNQLRSSSPGAVRLLDVRTPGEFESVHIPGSYNVPVDLLAEHAGQMQAVQTPVVLVCQSGRRAQQADTLLRTAGLRNVHVLDGGMKAWLDAGLPVTRGTPRMSLERQVRIAAGLLAGTGGFLALFVSPWFAAIPAFVGSGLVFAGVTDTCAMGMLLAKLPYNRAASCDPAAVVQALRTGQAPATPR